MSNSIDAFIPEVWSARVQKLREKMLISKAICNYEEQAGLSFGDTVHRPTSPEFVVNDYVRNVDVTLQDVTTGDEYMTIDQSKEVSFYIDKLDKKQSKYDVEMESVRRATYVIKNEMDARRMKEVLNASYTADANEVGGSSGTAATITATNAAQFFLNAKAILATNDVEDDRAWYAVVSPKMTSVIAQAILDSGFQSADSVLKNGYKGDAFGLKIYESTNLLHSIVATLDTAIATDVITVQGVTLTIVATIGTTAGNVLKGASDTATAANIVTLLNAPSVTTATGVALSTANINILKKKSITATSALGLITIYGAGEITATSVDTTITFGSLISHNEIGRMGTVDCVVQMNPEVQKNKDPKKTGYNWIIVDLYGYKTFTEGKVRMLDAQVAVA